MSGETAKDISKFRPHVPILAFAHTPKVPGAALVTGR